MVHLVKPMFSARPPVLTRLLEYGLSLCFEKYFREVTRALRLIDKGL